MTGFVRTERSRRRWRPATAASVALLMAALWAPAASSAALLGAYSFTGIADGTQNGFPVESPASDLTFGDMTTPDLTGIGVMSSFAASAQYVSGGYTPYVFDGKGWEVDWSVLGAGSDPGKSADPSTAARNNYLEFSVEPDPGFVLSVESVSIDFGTDFTTNYRPNVYYNLYYSIDDTNFYKIGDPSEARSNSNVWRVRNDVTKPFVANAAAVPTGTEKITFRLAFGDGKSGSDQKRLFVDDVNINGVVTPEPSTLALCGFAALALLRRRR